MTYVPQRYDSRIIEALALTGGLAPDLDRDALAAAAARTATWLDATDDGGRGAGGWVAEPAVGGWLSPDAALRGVTDHYIVDAALLASAEARKLHALGSEEAATYSAPATAR